MDRYSPFSIPTSVWVIEAYVQLFKSVALCVRTPSCLQQTDGRTDRHSSNVLEVCADQMSPGNIGSQIIISRCYKSINEINIPSLRRVLIICMCGLCTSQPVIWNFRLFFWPIRFLWTFATSFWSRFVWAFVSHKFTKRSTSLGKKFLVFVTFESVCLRQFL